MALFKLFGKKLKGEDTYFKQRKGEQRETVEVESVPYLQSDRLVNKDLLADLLKAMRNHDVSSGVAVLGNTTDSITRHAGIMINKGYIPKKIVSYLQNIRLRQIEDALSLIKNQDPDNDGYYKIDEGTAGHLNLPLGCMIVGIVHKLKKEFGVILVVKTALKGKRDFMNKVVKLISR